MFRFVPDNVGGVGTKRQHSGPPCETCKRRHKRCSHVPSHGRNGKGPVSTHASSSTASGDNHNHVRPVAEAGPASQSESRATALSEDAYLRFIGDLSPEASFLANQHHDEKDQGHHPRRGEIGVWFHRKPDQDAESPAAQSNQSTVDELSGRAGSGSIQRAGLLGLHALAPYLKRECLSVFPPEAEYRRLHDIFYEKIDPLFPILHGEQLDRPGFEMESVALKQSICMLAALDPDAREYLRLPHSDNLLTPMEFRGCIAAALKQALDMGFLQDSMTTLQVCVLMGFCVDKPSYSEISAEYCARAVHHSQNLGLHLGSPDESARREKTRRVFWCVWTLDRLNAATNGRPVLTHGRDMDKRMTESIPEQMPSFQLVIRTAKFLDDVISQYRPHADDSSRKPAGAALMFEDLVLETGSKDIGNSLLASIELFYLSVLILRERPTDAGALQAKRPSTNLQMFCATSIINLASSAQAGSGHTLSFWPLVPYALSLAASVGYQSMRHGGIPYKRRQAYDTFHSSCEILEGLSDMFYSAQAMSQLAMGTLQEVERVAIHNNNNTLDRNNIVKITAQHCDESRHEISSQTTSELDNTGGHLSEHQLRTSMPNAAEVGSIPVNNDMMGSNNMWNHLDQQLGAPFYELDTSFDLDRFDAAFLANLDPTCPLPADNQWGPMDGHQPFL